MRLALYCSLGALLVGGAVGWSLHPSPPPGVDLSVALKAASTWREKSSSKTVAGPERIVERWYKPEAPPPPKVPGCPPCPECVAHERVIERGPVVTERMTEGAGTTRIQEVVREVISPPRMNNWSIGAGATVDLHGAIGWQAIGSMRLAGPVWGDVWVQNLSSAGIGLRLEW